MLINVVGRDYKRITASWKHLQIANKLWEKKFTTENNTEILKTQILKSV